MPEGTDESSEYTMRMNRLFQKRPYPTRVFRYILFISLLLAISVTTAASAYTITATAVGHGTIEPSGMVTINPGDNSPPFWITPDSGYRSIMTIDGAVVAGSQGYTFINVNSDHALSVTFAPETGSLSVN